MRSYKTYRSEPGQARINSNRPGTDFCQERCELYSNCQTIRVLHVAQSIAGGIASFFEEIADYQSRAFGKANVSFLIPSGSEAHLPSIDPDQIITFAATSRRPGALLKFGQDAQEAIRRLRPDVVHLHSSFAGAVIRLFLRPGPGKPRVIYCPHGWAFGMETSKTRKLAYAAVERQLARRTDLILVNSATEYELALQFGLPPQKLKLVKNGIAWTSYLHRNDRTGDLHVAFIGRFDRQKGIDILFDAIRRSSLADIHFHVVGDSVLGGTVGRDVDARPNVTFHGWLDRAQTVALVEQMDAVVMPSRWEAFGLVAIEAMRSGVAVIGSNRGALPEVIKHGVGGYIFDIDDPDGLGVLLERLDAQDLRRLGASARRLWERDYVADRMNQLTCEAYEYVMTAPASVPGMSAGGSRKGTAAPVAARVS